MYINSVIEQMTVNVTKVLLFSHFQEHFFCAEKNKSFFKSVLGGIVVNIMQRGQSALNFLYVIGLE